MINILTNEDDFLMPIYLKESIVVIYGANELGMQIYKGSGINPGFCGVVPNVNFFIDNKASSIKKMDDILVVTLATFKKMILGLKNNAEINIIIATLNISESEKIETKLSKQFNDDQNNVFNIFSMVSYDLQIDKYGLYKKRRVWINPFLFEGYDHIDDFNQNPYQYLNEVNSKEPKYVMTSFNNFEYPEIKSRYWNSEDGLRKTICAKEKYKNNIYMLGYSRIRGLGSEDKYTIPNQLQYLIDDENMEYRVYNYAQPYEEDLQASIIPLFMKLKQIKLNEGDIVILPATHKPGVVYDYEYILQLTATLKKIKLYCDNYKVKLYFIYWQRIFDKPICTDKELNLYNYFKVVCKERRINEESRQYYHTLAIKSSKIIKGICLVNEINYIDPSSMFSDSKMNNKIFIDPGHYSPKANEEIAKLIFQEIFIKDGVKLICDSNNQWIQKQINTRLKMILTDEVYYKLDKYVTNLKQLSRSIEIMNNANPGGGGYRLHSRKLQSFYPRS
ncbi:MAG: hypothetical protein ATN31_10145 [Candidatus Epulonipiscioides saccharophilum]|nr:MAG: hypothetical protein ATN31_10145 [Epulopiscium sp. AS2M-Bin001]